MIKLLQDDFVEACELDVLRGALKWAEQVARDKEPDLLNKRKKEPSADLVRNALAPLLPYLRLEHVLPTNCPYVAKIFQVKKNLFSQYTVLWTIVYGLNN